MLARKLSGDKIVLRFIERENIVKSTDHSQGDVNKYKLNKLPDEENVSAITSQANILQNSNTLKCAYPFFP